MNVFVPQSIQTMMELAEIADVKRQIISPRFSTPIIGIVQDGVLGSYNLTSPTMKIDWKDAMNIISYTSIDDFTSIKKNTDIKGSDLFSLIVPNKINVSTNDFEIENGKIIKGQISKAHIGAKKQNSLIHLIWDEYGINETKNFIDDVQKLVNNFNLLNGFSCGIGDLDIPKDVTTELTKFFETKKLEAKHMITEMENNPDLLDQDTFEETLYSNLNNIREEASKMVMKNLKLDNNFYIMIFSGAKGEPINMGQMLGCIGQQAVEGTRIKKNVNGRTLQYFHKDDDTALARGFVEQSFLKGMHPLSFIFHNMGSREGLIDTAIKSVTGDTPIFVLENGSIRYVNIGDWIDIQLDDNNNKPKVKRYVDRDMELLDLENQVYIPTTDELGNVTWSIISAITRHDPGKELYEIKTKGGRKVIVTESKSLLIWIDGKFERMSTPEVRIGDFVPVTHKLCEPPIVNNYIDMQSVFPKTEYIYGSDFTKALKLLGTSRVTERLPANWWNNNNGKVFTLPYTKASSLQRASVRSNIENIKDGFVYPYHTNREEILIPEKFELNYCNGIFVGLFLAEGNADIPSGYIQITNMDDDIINFAKKWFESFNMKCTEEIKINKLNGTSRSIRGYSTMLAKFLTYLCGHGARNKFISPHIINANIEFVKGLLNGYFSGDGCVTKNSIQITSASKELIEGINILLSRMNIFGKTSVTHMKENNVGTVDIAPINVLSIRGQWAGIFADKILLIDINKSLKLKEMKNSEVHRNFKPQNDVVLDEITEINIIDIAKYPKVYDLTVPDTLNFGLANGLHVVDTAESGYMQRKLIKSMEDAMIKYDLTVRNANNTVIQFIYGDGGIDTTKQYEYTSKILELGNTEITRRYKFTDEELKANSDFTKKQNEEYIANLILMRNQIRDISIRTGLNQILLNKKFMLPINYFRIMSNKTKTGNGKLTVEYILKRIDEILSSSNTFLMCMNKNELVNPKSIKNIDQNIAKTLFKFSLHEHLAPKICLYDRKLSKEQFDIICNDIINSYNNHVVSVGEMIGTIAAQSLGEPLTQMTLNSVDWEEEIIISDNGFFKVVKIGEFTDKLIEENLEKVEHVGDIKDKEMGDTYYLDIKDKGISAISVNEDGKVSWNLIEAVTKHLPMNTDGTSDLVKITTEMGRTATATKAKSFLTRIDNKIVPIRGDELKIGTYLPTITEIPDNDIYNLNKFDISPYFPKNDYTNDIIPGNNLKHHKGDVQRQVLKNITDESTDEQKIINDCMDSKIYYDKIKAIELISPTKKYVYDLTVANDKTFALGGGLVQNDTFHSAGIGGMGTTTLGVPRIKEIFSFSRNMKTPIMIIYMEDKLRKNKEIVEKIASSIEKTTIGDIRDRVDVYYDPTPFAKDGFMEKDSVTNVFHHVTQSKYSCQSDISGLPWLMRIVLNKEKMMEKDITLLDIKSKFCNYWEKRFNDIKGTKKEDKQLLEKINQCSLLSNNDNDTVPILHLRFDMKDFNYGTITSFLDNLIDGFQLKGIQNIEKINAVVDERLTTFDQDQAEKVDSQYVIYAAGINMTALRYINGIDLNKTKSNDIVDICEKYGIEAARMALLKECESVYGTSGNFVNYQHISVLADVMTNNGTLTTIDRHGLNKVETDPFARASFEKTVDQFIQAAVYSEVDHMKSVSSRIMAGLAIKGGTGFCDVVLDYELLEKSEYIEDVENKYVKTFHKLSANPVMNDILSKAPSEVFMPDV